MRAKFIILLGFFVASFSLLLARLIDVALVQGQHFSI
jgi:cell division protein FtsI/penicillin-binding protein 2